MKQVPQVIRADELALDWPECYIETVADTKRVFWALARPHSTGGLLTRIRIAAKVFTGEYDALKWEQQ